MAIPNIKEIFELIKKGATIEAQQKIVELRETVISLQEENINLKKENLALKQQIEVLEKGERCPMCKKPAWNLMKSKPYPGFEEEGASVRTYKCSACGFTEDKPVIPSIG
jgi:Zn finger protein HypA/HybF involved in hydrogenase expression